MASPVHTYFYSMVEVAVVKFFLDHQIFRAIPCEDDASICHEELASKSGVELSLLVRFLNFLIAAGVLSAPKPGHVAHTTPSMIWLREDASCFFQHIFDFFFVSAARWPSTTLLGGEVLAPPPILLYLTRLQKAASFNATMALAVAEMPVTGTYDFSWVDSNVSDGPTGDRRAILVDVGGGKGQALKAILEENPHIPADRCVLQDNVDEVVKQDRDGVMNTVGKQVVNFFDEQPVKGAPVYHVRRVLNDWPDEACFTILRRLREACAPDSRVLVAENLLPPQALGSIDLCAVDLFMMNFGGKRRTEENYAHIASSAGFRISSVSWADPSKFAVIEMVPI
ncbi:hypothetical protein PG991_011952 [Apiospora marii]|uniref:O-methyltransferase C-terminal domain-containing protein n=1 Tax=Apiospora marii TaxID=335849 RepID=A0ABR1RFN2_9PEZI